MTATRNTATLLQSLPIEQLQASRTNPRQHFDRAGLDELKASIAASGIQVPLLVRPMLADGQGMNGAREYLDRPLRAGLAERSFDEIADSLQMSRGDAKKLFRSGINKLRQQRHALPRMIALSAELQLGRCTAHTLHTGEIRAARRRGGRA